MLQNHNILEIICTDLKKLNRYRIKGIFIIRNEGTVLFIGGATNVYKVARRLFQKGGALNHLSPLYMEFEIIKTGIRFHTVENVLKRYLKPKYNRRIEKINNPSKHQKEHFKRILNSYIEQSISECQGNQKGDYPESNQGNAKGDY